MDLNIIKEQILVCIDSASKLINEFADNPNQIQFKYPQLPIEFKDFVKDNQNKELIFFLKRYKLLFESNINAFRSLYTRKNVLNELFDFVQIIKVNLEKLDECIDNIHQNVFDRGLSVLAKEEKEELVKIISDGLKTFNEDKKIYIKEFKRRIREITEIANKYLNLSIILIQQIKKLAKNLDFCFENFIKAKQYFQNDNDIKYGKYFISDLYRKMLIFTDEINNIFIMIEKEEQNRIVRPLLKLIKIEESLEAQYSKIYEDINNIIKKYNYGKVGNEKLKLGLEEITIINENCTNLAFIMRKIYQNINTEFNSIYNSQNEIRLDILFILDTTSSMDYFIDKFKNQFLNIITNIRKECPEALVYVGLIGYKDISDLDLGDEYLDYDLTTNYEKLNININLIEPDGGDDIPEDIPGAFELAFKKLNKSWTGNSKIAILITDSPCHGSEFHNLNQNENGQSDMFADGDPEGRDKNMIENFVKYKISLFCVSLDKNTDKMYNIFMKKYERIKPPDSLFDFYIEKNFESYEFIEKIKDLFDKNLKDLIKENNNKRKSRENNKINIDINNNIESLNELK